jgi:hypothetical protein
LLYQSHSNINDETEKDFNAMNVFFVELVKITDEDTIRDLIISPLINIISNNPCDFTANKNYLPIGTF